MKKYLFLVMLSTCVASFAQQPLSGNSQNNTERLVDNINDNEFVLSSMPDESAQVPDMKISSDPKLAETYVYCKPLIYYSSWVKRIEGVKIIKGVEYVFLDFGVSDTDISMSLFAKDLNGRELQVRSKIDALNKLTQLGWVVVGVTPVVSAFSDKVNSVSEYYIRKKVKDLLPAEWEYYRKYIML